MANDLMKYKDFLGSVHYDADGERFVGRIEEIPDIVTFEGSSVEELKEAFHTAVDDYIRLCEETNRPMRRSFKGTFNVRVTPGLHRDAFRCAIESGLSLNQFVQQAIEHEVRERFPGYHSIPADAVADGGSESESDTDIETKR
ncbi:MAG: type II toxin-antitoxin system HicB family antitoxin [Alkalispirochaeta sp.]